MREFVLVANVAFSLTALDAIERRLRNVDVATIDEFLHVAEEKRQQQRADVRAVDVRIGHENYFVIAQLARVEVILADARAERRDDRANFFVPEHFVVTRFFDVEDLALERQDRLVFAVAAHFRRAAGGLALDHKQFAARRIALLAIGEFTRQAARIHRGFAARQFARFASGFAGARRIDALGNNAPSHGRMLVEPFAKLLVDELLDVALDIAVQLAFGLSFKLRLRQAHGNNSHQAFANVVTRNGHFIFLFFQHARGRREIVDRARQRRTKTGKVRAAIHGVDGVREGENVFAVRVVVLQRDFYLNGAALPFDVDRRIE